MVQKLLCFCGEVNTSVARWNWLRLLSQFCGQLAAETSQRDALLQWRRLRGELFAGGSGPLYMLTKTIVACSLRPSVHDGLNYDLLNVSRHAGYTVAITGSAFPSLAAPGKFWHLRAQRSIAWMNIQTVSEEVQLWASCKRV